MSPLSAVVAHTQNKSKKIDFIFQDRNSFTAYVCCCGPQQPKKNQRTQNWFLKKRIFPPHMSLYKFRKHRIEWWRFEKDLCVVWCCLCMCGVCVCVWERERVCVCLCVCVCVHVCTRLPAARGMCKSTCKELYAGLPGTKEFTPSCTHYKTMQQTATHYNMGGEERAPAWSWRQVCQHDRFHHRVHTATHCNTLQHGRTREDTCMELDAGLPGKKDSTSLIRPFARVSHSLYTPFTTLQSQSQCHTHECTLTAHPLDHTAVATAMSPTPHSQFVTHTHPSWLRYSWFLVYIFRDSYAQFVTQIHSNVTHPTLTVHTLDHTAVAMTCHTRERDLVTYVWVHVTHIYGIRHAPRVQINPVMCSP